MSSLFAAADFSDLAFKDELTGLYNRRFISRVFKSFPSSSLALEGTNISLLLIDVDHFKQLNDNFGHQEGDELLAKLGGLLGSYSDDSKRFAARYGGDEFLLVLVDTTKQEAYELGLQIVDKFKSTILSGNQNYAKLNLGISVGVAALKDDGDDLNKVFTNADKAMYSSKQLGTCRVTSYGEASEEDTLKLQCLMNLVDETIVARPEELEQLLQMVRSFQDHTSSKWFVIIEGDNGSGKTSLLLSARRRLSDAKINVVYKKCQPFDVHVPYGLVREMILGLCRDNRNKEMLERELNDKQKSVLGKIAPELYKTSPRMTLNKAELYEVLLMVFSKFSSVAPIVFMIDNGHYVDEASYSVLGELGQLVDKRPVVVITSSHEDASSQPKFVTFKTDVVEFTDKLILEPLSRNATARFIKDLLGGFEIQDEICDSIYRRSLGITMAICSLVKECLITDSISLVNQQWTLLKPLAGDEPVTLKERVERSIESFDGKSKGILNKASVIGEKIELDLLKGVAKSIQEDISEGEIISSVDRLIKENILKARDPGDIEELEFTSRTLQKIVYESISEKEKKGTHYDIARFQEERFKDNPDQVADQLFYHYQSAGDAEKAAIYAEKIKEQFINSFDDDELAKYVQVKLGTTRAKIPEFRHDLSAEAQKKILNLFREMINALKIYKIYPADSRIVRDSMSEVYSSLATLLDETGGFTLAREEMALRLNNAVIGKESFDMACVDVSAFLGAKKIQSLTFLKGLQKPEFGSLMDVLQKESKTAIINPEFWEQLFEDFSIKSVGVVTYSYLGERRKEDESGEMIIDFIKSFNGMLELSRVYSPKNKLVIERILFFMERFRRLVGDKEGCFISMNGRDILFNGKLVDPSRLKGTTKSIEAFFTKFRLNSVMFKNGVTQEELETLLELVDRTKGIADEDAAREAAAFTSGGIMLEQRELVRKTVSAGGVIQAMSPAERAANFLSRSVPEFLEIGSDAMITLCNTLREMNDPVWLKLIKRYKDIISAGDAHSKRALDVFVVIADALYEHLKSDLDVSVFISDDINNKSARNSVIFRHLDGLFSSSDPSINPLLMKLNASDDYSALINEKAAYFLKENFDKSYSLLNADCLARFAQNFKDDKAFLMSVARGGDYDKSLHVLKSIKNLSSGAACEVVAVITELDAVLMSRYALNLDLSREQLVQFVQVLLEGGKAGVLQDCLKELLAASEQNVHEIAVAYMTSCSDPNLLGSFVRIVTYLKVSRLERHVSALVERHSDDKLLLACMTYLTNFPYPGSYDRLKTIITSKKGFLVKKAVYAGGVRARAILAISKLNERGVSDVIKSCLKDRDQEVQAAAQVSFKELLMKS